MLSLSDCVVGSEWNLGLAEELILPQTEEQKQQQRLHDDEETDMVMQAIKEAVIVSEPQVLKVQQTEESFGLGLVSRRFHAPVLSPNARC